VVIVAVIALRDSEQEMAPLAETTEGSSATSQGAGTAAEPAASAGAEDSQATEAQQATDVETGATPVAASAESGVSEPAAMGDTAAAAQSEAPKSSDGEAVDAAQAAAPAAGGESGSAPTQAQAQSQVGVATPQQSQSEAGADSAPAQQQAAAVTAASQEQLAALPGGQSQLPRQPPSFDIVRVEGSGEAVVAGRAEPFSTITLLEGEVIYGSVVADRNGNWVLLPSQALAPGSHELTLRAMAPDGRTSESADAVLVVVPERSRAVAKAEPKSEGTATQQSPEEQGAPQATQPEATEQQTAPAQQEQSEQALAVLVPRSGQGASQVLQAPDGEGLQDRELILSAVDYDENGRIIISGYATSGARVFAFLDDREIGDSEVNEAGRWVITPKEIVAVGLHRLRIDQIDASGAVVARIETPFSRAQMLTKLPGERFFVVQPGHSLWRIARHTYGSGFQYTLIFGSNKDQIRDPDLIYPGQVFILPEQQ
jgi:nucleoid-associated protein YgaU